MEYVLTVCNNQKKIQHLFLSCPKVKNFWRELREWLNTNVNIELSIEEREILFSYTGNNELVNFINALAKLFINQNKFISRTINIQGFICLLKKKMLSEKYISFLYNKMNKFLKNGLQCITISSQLWQKSEIFAIPVGFWCWLFAIDRYVFFYIIFLHSSSHLSWAANLC